MPLPIDACAANVPTQVCCSSIFDVAERIRCIAYEAVLCCIDVSCADQEFRSYVSLGPSIPEPLGDALIVHLLSMSPSSGSRGPTGILNRVSLQEASFEIFLTENGWPTPETDELGEVVYVPDADLINRVARHSYGHGERMYRAMLNSAQKGLMFPLPANAHIGRVDVGNLQPVQPAAFTAGWTIPVSVQMMFPPLFDPYSVGAMIAAPTFTAEAVPA